jgi:hypothetical protein
MRRFRLRIKIRTLMIGISAVAVILGVGIAAARLKARSSAYRARAAEYASKEELFTKHIKYVVKMAAETEEAARDCTEESRNHSGFDRLLVVANSKLFRAQTTKHKNSIARYQAKADWYAMMKTRYQFAGSHPWLSVPPDPPEPR